MWICSWGRRSSAAGRFWCLMRAWRFACRNWGITSCMAGKWMSRTRQTTAATKVNGHMADEQNIHHFLERFLERWADEFGRAIETFTNERPTVTHSRLDEAKR